jgi:hypothetical protein
VVQVVEYLLSKCKGPIRSRTNKKVSHRMAKASGRTRNTAGKSVHQHNHTSKLTILTKTNISLLYDPEIKNDGMTQEIDLGSVSLLPFRPPSLHPSLSPSFCLIYIHLFGVAL